MDHQMKILIKYLFLAAFCLLPSICRAQAEISDVTFEWKSKTGTVAISYYLQLKKTKKITNVTVYMSRDGGATFRKLTQVSGDVGTVYASGYKEIFFDIFKEFGNVTISGDLQFKVTGETEVDRFDKKTFLTANLTLSNTLASSYGLTIGHFKRWGWYVSAMTNFNFTAFSVQPVGYTYEHFSASYTGEISLTRFSATVGVLFKPSPVWAIYAGAGYRQNSLLWEKTNGEWVEYVGESYFDKAIPIEAGLLLDLNGFTLSAGFTGGPGPEIKIGIGVNF
jgi:hypothetical protein